MRISFTNTQKTLIVGVVAVVLLVFLAVNVAASQLSYSPLMFRVLGLRDVDAAREYLVNLEGSGLELRSGESVYEVQARYMNSHFDNIFAREVDIGRLNTDNAIVRYEELLTLNENNPQILVALGLLYEERGDKTKSTEYFDKARAIDPWIEVE